MFNLFKSDLYRMVRMVSFWVCIVVSVAMMIAIAAAMNWLASPEFAVMVTESAMEQSLEAASPEEQVQMRLEVAEDLEEIEPLNAKILEGGVTTTWSNTFLDGGFLGAFGSLFVIIFFMMDFKNGFVKNLPMDRKGRMAYFGEKLLFVGLIQAIFLLVCACFSTGAFWAFGFTQEVQDSFGEIALWLVLAWLVCVAYGSLVACITLMVKSEALSTVMAVGVSSGVLGSLLSTLLNYIGVMIPLFTQAPQWMLVSTYRDLRNGGAALMGLGDQGLFAMAPVFVHVLVIAAIYIAVAVVVTFVVCRKQDIR